MRVDDVIDTKLKEKGNTNFLFIEMITRKVII